MTFLLLLTGNIKISVPQAEQNLIV